MCQQFLLLPFVSNILSGAFSDSQHLSVMDEQKSEMLQHRLGSPRKCLRRNRQIDPRLCRRYHRTRT